MAVIPAPVVLLLGMVIVALSMRMDTTSKAGSLLVSDASTSAISPQAEQYLTIEFVRDNFETVIDAWIPELSRVLKLTSQNDVEARKLIEDGLNVYLNDVEDSDSRDGIDRLLCSLQFWNSQTPSTPLTTADSLGIQSVLSIADEKDAPELSLVFLGVLAHGNADISEDYVIELTGADSDALRALKQNNGELEEFC